MSGVSVGSELRKIVYAKAGSGPLLERDYFGVIEGAGFCPKGASAQLVPFQIQVSPNTLVPLKPPKTTIWPLASVPA